MIGFGKSKELKAAEEQRKIDKLKIKTEKEKLGIEKDRTKMKIREKNGGLGIGGNIALHDVTPPKNNRGCGRRK